MPDKIKGKKYFGNNIKKIRYYIKSLYIYLFTYLSVVKDILCDISKDVKVDTRTISIVQHIYPIYI
jgi:hypothetical protein